MKVQHAKKVTLETSYTETQYNYPDSQPDKGIPGSCIKSQIWRQVLIKLPHNLENGSRLEMAASQVTESAQMVFNWGDVTPKSPCGIHSSNLKKTTLPTLGDVEPAHERRFRVSLPAGEILNCFKSGNRQTNLWYWMEYLL